MRAVDQKPEYHLEWPKTSKITPQGVYWLLNALSQRPHMASISSRDPVSNPSPLLSMSTAVFRVLASPMSRAEVPVT